MHTTTMEEAQAHLAAWRSRLKPGEELLITDQDRPVARLIPEPSVPVKPRQPGSAIGKLTVVEDDESHLEDCREYML